MEADSFIITSRRLDVIVHLHTLLCSKSGRDCSFLLLYHLDNKVQVQTSVSARGNRNVNSETAEKSLAASAASYERFERV